MKHKSYFLFLIFLGIALILLSSNFVFSSAEDDLIKKINEAKTEQEKVYAWNSVGSINEKAGVWGGLNSETKTILWNKANMNEEEKTRIINVDRNEKRNEWLQKAMGLQRVNLGALELKVNDKEEILTQKGTVLKLQKDLKTIDIVKRDGTDKISFAYAQTEKNGKNTETTWVLLEDGNKGYVDENGMYVKGEQNAAKVLNYGKGGGEITITEDKDGTKFNVFYPDKTLDEATKRIVGKINSINPNGGAKQINELFDSIASLEQKKLAYETISPRQTYALFDSTDHLVSREEYDALTYGQKTEITIPEDKTKGIPRTEFLADGGLVSSYKVYDNGEIEATNNGKVIVRRDEDFINAQEQKKWDYFNDGSYTRGEAYLRAVSKIEERSVYLETDSTPTIISFDQQRTSDILSSGGSVIGVYNQQIQGPENKEISVTNIIVGSDNVKVFPIKSQFSDQIINDITIAEGRNGIKIYNGMERWGTEQTFFSINGNQIWRTTTKWGTPKDKFPSDDPGKWRLELSEAIRADKGDAVRFIRYGNEPENPAWEFRVDDSTKLNEVLTGLFPKSPDSSTQTSSAETASDTDRFFGPVVRLTIMDPNQIKYAPGKNPSYTSCNRGSCGLGGSGSGLRFPNFGIRRFP